MIEFNQTQHWMTIRINRPERRNALTQDMLKTLKTVLTKVNADQNIRGASIVGEGGYFSAGLDLAEYKALYGSDGPVEDNVLGLFELLERFDKPLVGVVQGGARAAGVGLLSACDVVIAAPDTDYGVGGTAIGLPPLPIVPVMVVKIGQAATRKLLLTSQVVDANEAKHLGLVDEIAEDVDAKHEEIKALICRCAPDTMRRTKRFIGAGERCYQVIYTKLMKSDEAREGMASFLEKREASWVVEP